MKRKLLLRATAGFFAGIAIGFIISLLTGGINHLASDRLIAMTDGSVPLAYVIQFALSGVIGLVSFAGTLLYESERLNLVAATFLHLFLILVTYFPISLFLGWLKPDVTVCLIMAGIMTVVFFIIWLIMYLVGKKQARELNKLQETYRKNDTER